MGKFTDRIAAREPTVNAVIAEKKYTLFGTFLIKNAVIGIVIPEIRVAPLVSHWARLDDTPKYSVKFGIIFAVTVVDIDVINAAASSVTKIPVLCTFDILSLLLIIYFFLSLCPNMTFLILRAVPACVDLMPILLIKLIVSTAQ